MAILWYITLVKTKKLIILAVLFALLGIAFGLLVANLIRLKKPTAGLKVDSNPPSLVFVDNVQVGRTPVDKMFAPGDITVKLIPESTSAQLSSYQTNAHLTDKVYTVIKRDFGTTEALSSGEIISLLPQSGNDASLSIITSDPESASVTVDNQPQGFSPLAITSVSASDHQIEISSPGYQTKTVSARAISGYKLTVNVKLAFKNQVIPSVPPAMVSETPTATASPSLVPTPAITKPYVRISSTPTGFLRVRLGPSTAAGEIGQVRPGETYPLLDSTTGWYLIKVVFPATSSGWISSDYAQAFK
jgi:hypothetical protein